MTKKIHEIVWFLPESAIILENRNLHSEKALNKSENYLRLPFTPVVLLRIFKQQSKKIQQRNLNLQVQQKEEFQEALLKFNLIQDSHTQKHLLYYCTVDIKFFFGPYTLVGFGDFCLIKNLENKVLQHSKYFALII